MRTVTLPMSPETELSRSLLSSVPKKIHLWLQNLGWDETRVFRHGPLVYINSGDGGLITYVRADSVLQIAWTGDPESVSEISTNEPLFCRIEDSLELFTSIEVRLYRELEEYESSLNSSGDSA